MENNEKVFINICQSNGIPPPEDISAEQLTEILASETPSTYKIPMSITQLRIIGDKAGKDAIVCDVAIHTDFFRKIESVTIFRDFLITIIFEALDTKYNLQINRETWFILKNRKCIGKLEKHRVQNRDAVNVYQSYQNPSKEHKTAIKELNGDSEKNEVSNSTFITEINGNAIQIKSNTYLKNRVAVEIRKPQHRMFESVGDTSNYTLIAEFFMPEVVKQNDINLDLGTDRIVVEARRPGYFFESFLPHNIDENRSNAEFNTNTRVSLNRLVFDNLWIKFINFLLFFL